MSQRNSPFKRRQSISIKSTTGEIGTTISNTTSSNTPSSSSTTTTIQRQPLKIESKISFNFKKRKDPNDENENIKLGNESIPTNQLNQLSIDNTKKDKKTKDNIENSKNDENNNCTDSNKIVLASSSTSSETESTNINNEAKTPQSCLKKSINNGKTPKSTKKVKYFDYSNIKQENKEDIEKQIKKDTEEIKEDNKENDNESQIVNINQTTTTSTPTIIPTTTTPNEELPQHQPTREKITPSAESKERMILLRNILIDKLKDTPQHLKKHVREINKIFLLQVLKIPIPKEDEQQSIIKQQQQQQKKKLQQQQQEISLANAQSSFLNKPTNNTELSNTTISSLSSSSLPVQMSIESIGNLKNLEVLMRIHTLKILIGKWSEEEKKWKILLKEYSSNGKESIILQTPSRTKIAATNSIQNSIKKQQKPTKSSSTSTPSTTSSTQSNQGENDKNINNNKNNSGNQLISPIISDDPKMIIITNSISKLSIQLDEVRPRLKQVEQNSIDIEKFYDETSVYYQKQSLKNLKDVDNPKKLIKNLLSNNTVPLSNK
ncbi:hypothetical protein RB653_003989 [Dictyostelium firmibasis]|uniref:Uncharacterized protein n=1 Tax=Dictyostelium firmibasis TaxID=79012 RepID=A0AAN7YWM2_9MYCE